MENSRLGKLLSLLDAKNAIVRRQAAQEIGDVARLHPSQLNSLLSSLRRCIKSTSNWDARVSAAFAFKEICRNLLTNRNETDGNVKEGDAVDVNDVPCFGYDLPAVMASDFRLLGSEGTEFDVEVIDSASGKLSGTNSAGRHNQRLRVAKQLGFLIPQISNVAEIVTDDDLAYDGEVAGRAAGGESEYRPTPPKLFKVEMVEAEAPSDPDVEPKLVLINFLRSLCADLYDPNWTSRHGAAIALKEASSCPQLSVLLDEHQSTHSPNATGLSASYILRHVFNVLAVDRFNDFVGDHVVAPVRETCAQLIATVLCFRRPISKRGNEQSIFRGDQFLGNVLTICEAFLKYSNDPKQWECRHAGLLAIKYISGAMRDILVGSGFQTQLCSIFDATVETLGDSNDDVVIAAAQALLPLVDTVKSLSPDRIHGAIDRCWHLLSNYVTAMPVASLDNFLTDNAFLPNDAYSICDSSTCEDQSAADGLFQLLESSLEPLNITDGRLLLLLPFFSHSQSYTRQRLCAVLTRSAENGTLFLSDPVWSMVLVRTFISCIIDDNVKTAELLASELWPALLKLRSSDVVWNLCRPMLGQWLACLMVTERAPLNSVICGSPSAQFPAKGIVYVGGRETSTLNDQERDQAVISARLRGARALAAICDKIINATADPNCDPRQCLTQLVSLHLLSNSAYQRQAVCVVLCEWSKILEKESEKSGVSLFFADTRTLLENLLSLTPAQPVSTPTVYDEVILNASEIHAACRDFLSMANVSGAEAEQISAAAMISNTKEAEEMCGRALQASIQGQNSTVSPTELTGRYEQVKELIRRNAAQMDRINIRASSWLASCYVRIGGVPSKFNPIVQPLMNCVKNEVNRLLVNESAQCLALLLQISPPVPSSKVVKNLSVLHSSDPKLTPGLLSMEEKPAEKKILSWEVKSGRETVQADLGHQSLTARNAGFALKGIVSHFGMKLAQFFPTLHDSLTSPLTKSDNSECFDQNMINSMQILETVYPSLPNDVRARVREVQIPAMCKNLKHNSSVVRHMSCRCLSVMAETDLASVLNAMLPSCLELLSPATAAEKNGDDTIDEENGQLGAIELAYLLVEKLDVNLIGIIPLLAVPVLAAMSSCQGDIRSVASYTFGQLVKLMPVETDDRTLPGLSAELIALRRRRLEFLHLLNKPDDLGRHLCDGEEKGKQILRSINVNGELRSYQRDGIVWLRFLAEYGLHGILCDDMGLGKTVQTLAALASGLMAAGTGNKKASLIICPKTLTSHWMNEIKKFFGDDTETERAILKATCVIDRMVPIDVSSFNVVVASYDLFRKETSAISTIDSILSYRWHYCILDEGHVIRNPKTRLFRSLTHLKSDHRLILSGTPVQNSVLEMWSLFEFLMPGYLGTQAQFQARFGKPILLSRDAKASSAEAEAGQAALDNLHKLVLPFVLRRRKCDVLDDLPPKIIQDSPCLLSALQSQLYEDFSRIIKDKFSSSPASSASGAGRRQGAGAFQVLLYLRKLCDHPCLVMDEKHPNYHQINDRLAAGEFGVDCQQLNDFRLSGKMMALKQLLSECGIGRSGEAEDEDEVPVTVSQHRALIFCQFKAVIALIAQYFDAGVFGKSVTYRRLDGDVPPSRRQAIVDQFNDDPSIDVLLLSTQIGGLGLNLTGADVVIFVDHDWNPANDLQAMDRAHRIGQKRTVNVYRLITCGTLEEKIMRLQQFKTRTADSLIGDENRSLMSMATGQLLDLLTLDSAAQSGNAGDSAGAKMQQLKKQERRKSRDNRAGESSTGSGFSSVDLPSLWDQSQYDEAFDYNAFITNIPT